MAKDKRSLLVGAGAILLCAAVGAHAQNSSTGTIIGPPQLKDFSLEPQQRIVSQPPPAEQRPVEVAPPAPTTTAPSREPPARAAAAPRTAEPRREAATAAPPPSAPVAEAPPADQPAAPVEASEPVPVAAAPTTDEPAQPASGGTPFWYFALPAVALALIGAAVVRRRRRVSAERVVDPVPVAAAPPPVKPRPDPVPRPWLEIGLKAERAAFNATEAEIAFELEISNKGGSPARNLRIDVKLFNAGAEQDKEIGAFFRTAGRESTKLKLPGVAAGVSGMIQGTVGMPREEMRAMRLDERLLFIPVIAVNILYDWGEGRSGQTSKSYVIGREKETPGEKMGAFRVDQGPRIWRSVGQRAHKLAKRV
jgi:hypothetical protein